MARTQYYRYNPETDNYERVFPTLARRMASVAKVGITAFLLGCLFFLIAYNVFGTPGERRLQEENSMLKQQYELLNRRLDNSLQVMENIRYRDDNFYRVMMQMEPLSDVHRNAGLNNEKRYRELSKMSDNGLVKYVTQRVDMLDRQIYAQSLSFDQLKESAVSQKDKIAHIPAILPIDRNKAVLSGGYGMRRDPVSGIAKFHPGLDFAAPEGTPVFATADGEVVVAERKNNDGNVIEINHGFNYMSGYMHLADMTVNKGDFVKRGDRIGTVGRTGKATAPHLHYEVRFRGEAQNPVNFGFMELTPANYADFVTAAENAADIMD